MRWPLMLRSTHERLMSKADQEVAHIRLEQIEKWADAELKIALLRKVIDDFYVAKIRAVRAQKGEHVRASSEVVSGDAESQQAGFRAEPRAGT